MSPPLQHCNATKQEWRKELKLTLTNLSPLCKKRGSGFEVGFHRHASAMTVASSRGSWLRDLTVEGVEPNPGPVMCQHDACKCTNSKNKLMRPVESGGRGLQEDGICVCKHPVFEHEEEAAAAASSAATATFPLNPGAMLSSSVGRVLVAAAGSEEYTFAGQCVAIHPRLLMTATHVCFDSDDGTELDVLVGFKADREAPLKLYRASLIRYSGTMDVSILLLDVATTDSPFRPILIATSAVIDRDFSDTCCALASFSVSNDGEAIRQVDEKSPSMEMTLDHLMRLPHVPPFLRSTVMAVQERSYGNTLPRSDFLIGLSAYPNEKGISGGAVVGMERGEIVLFGIHTHNQRLGTTEEYKFISSRLQVGEYDGGPREMSTSRQRSSDTGDRLQHRSNTNSNRSAPTSESPQLIKGATPAIRSKLQHVAGGVASKSVFAVAHSVLRGRWSMEELIKDIPAGTDSLSASTTSASPQPATPQRPRRIRKPISRYSPSAVIRDTSKAEEQRAIALLYDDDE